MEQNDIANETANDAANEITNDVANEVANETANDITSAKWCWVSDEIARVIYTFVWSLNESKDLNNHG